MFLVSFRNGLQKKLTLKSSFLMKFSNFSKDEFLFKIESGNAILEPKLVP